MTKEELFKGVKTLYDTALLKVSKNGMEAVLTPLEHDIKPEYLSEFPDTLEKFGITYGISKAFGDRDEDEKWVVARGSDPLNGEDGRIEFMPQFEALKDVSSKSIEKIFNVGKGNVIAEIISPTTGTPGRNIFGEELAPKPGRPASFKLGEGAEISPDGACLLASRSGAVEFKEEKIAVLDAYSVNGDLTGNLEFWGRLFTIAGSISGAFKVLVWGDLEVGGNIESEARVTTKGNLKVGGIIRGNGTFIDVGQDLSCKALEYAHVYVNGDLEAGDYILKADCKVKGYGWVIQGRGMIMGGDLIIGHSIAVNTLGTATSIFTHISIGFDFDSMTKHNKIINEIEDISKKLEDAKNSLKKIEILEHRGPLDEKYLFIKNYLSESLVKLGEDALNKKEELERLEKELLVRQSAVVFVNKNVYSNTRITIYNASLDVKNDINGKHKFIYKDGEIAAVPLR